MSDGLCPKEFSAMRDYFINLFHYNEWANKQVFVKLPEVIDRDPSILLLFSHVVMVERLWLGRILRSDEKFPVWEPIPLPELIRHVNLSAQNWGEFLASLTDDQLKRQIPYVNTQGVAYQNSITEIVTQTVHHGTHHRGQIVSAIRRLGIEPPVLDYIAYLRSI
jgi:uncharacterized damage-inducible protein DinB